MNREPTELDALADSYTLELAALDPMAATYLGISGFDDQMTDMSPDGIAQRTQLTRETLAKLDSITPVDATDRVTLDAMRDRLGLDVEMFEAGEYHRDLNVIASPLQGIRDIFDLMSTKTEDDWATVAKRMAAVPEAVFGYLESLRWAAKQGMVAPALQVAEGVKQADELADPESSFFTTFTRGATVDGQPVTASLAGDLAASATAATEAYGRLSEFLQSLADQAPADDAAGRERYALASRYFVGATVDLDETYEWGLEELARVAAEQDAVIEAIAGSGATIDDAVKKLDEDASRKLHGTAALREWMQQTADEAITALHGTHFDIPDEIRTIECMIAPTQNGGIYYTGPSDDFTRPGRMWWSVPPGVTEFNTWREKTTVYHEGVPGHHLQIGQAVWNREQLNMWRRMVSWSSGHGEGWALYSERLMQEFGFMDDLGDLLGLLDGQRMRATRVVLDIGVHLKKPAPQRWGGGTWDAEKAWDLLRSNVNMDEAFLRFELNRYLGWPGQAPSYKIGQRLWEQIRAEASAQQGAAFSLKEFHTKALNLGSVPLDTLRQAMVGDLS